MVLNPKFEKLPSSVDDIKLQKILERLETIDRRLDSVDRALHQRPVCYENNLITVEQAAKETGLSKTTLYRLKQCQVKLGRAVRISRQALDRYMETPGQLR